MLIILFRWDTHNRWFITTVHSPIYGISQWMGTYDHQGYDHELLNGMMIFEWNKIFQEKRDKNHGIKWNIMGIWWDKATNLQWFFFCGSWNDDRLVVSHIFVFFIYLMTGMQIQFDSFCGDRLKTPTRFAAIIQTWKAQGVSVLLRDIMNGDIYSMYIYIIIFMYIYIYRH